MKLSDSVLEHIGAGFSGLWIQTHEPEYAATEINTLAQNQGWSINVWDIVNGYRGHTPAVAKDPIDAVAHEDKSRQDVHLVLLFNYHPFLKNPVVVQNLANAIHAGKSTRTFYLILSPIVQIPPELEKLFVVLDHELPGPEQLVEVAGSLVDTEGKAIPFTEGHISGASGLTHYEAEGAFALSLVRHGSIEADAIFEVKSNMLKKQNLLTLYRNGASFASLGGLTALKSFCSRSLVGPLAGIIKASARPKGVLLAGVPGTGKSQFCKALGSEFGLPVLICDPGRAKGSLVGESEQQWRTMLAQADAMAPCILMFDEIEKALAGGTAQHVGDSGVSKGQLGTLLTWLNDHTSDVYVVCTANDVSALPPEFARAERFDALFFLDLPGTDERYAIWDLYEKRYQLSLDGKKPYSLVDDKNWTGAEIQSCCRLAAMLDTSLAEASSYVVPVADTAAEKIQALREWAQGRCIDANKGGVYTLNKTTASEGKRTVRAKR